MFLKPTFVRQSPFVAGFVNVAGRLGLPTKEKRSSDFVGLSASWNQVYGWQR